VKNELRLESESTSSGPEYIALTVRILSGLSHFFWPWRTVLVSVQEQGSLKSSNATFLGKTGPSS